MTHLNVITNSRATVEIRFETTIDARTLEARGLDQDLHISHVRLFGVPAHYDVPVHNYGSKERYEGKERTYWAILRLTPTQYEQVDRYQFIGGDGHGEQFITDVADLDKPVSE